MEWTISRCRTGRGRRARRPSDACPVQSGLAPSVGGCSRKIVRRGVSLPSWTTSTSCADQPVFWRCTASSKKSSMQLCGRSAEIPDQERGVRVLGAPIGSSEYVLAQLNVESKEQRLLLQIPAVPDLQLAWLLLLLCRATRANFWLCMAGTHCSLLNNITTTCGVFPHSWDSQPAVAVSMPLNKGSLGLGSAAHWASWADCLSMVNKRDSAMARWMVEGIQHGPVFSCCPGLATGIGQHCF